MSFYSKSEVTTRRRRRPRRISPPPLHHSKLALPRLLQHQPIALFLFVCFFSFDIRSRRFCFRRGLVRGGVRTIINLRTVARRGSFRSNQIAGTPFRSTTWKGESRLLLLASSTHGFAHCIVIGFRNKGSDFGFRSFFCLRGRVLQALRVLATSFVEFASRSVAFSLSIRLCRFFSEINLFLIR